MRLSIEERVEFGLRVKMARLWKGITRKEEFGEALARAYPGWPAKSNAKRVEDGVLNLSSDDRDEWAARVAEYTGVPEWFMYYGWEPPSTVTVPGSELQELQETVDLHTRLLREIDAKVTPSRLSLVSSAEQTAEEMSQPRAQQPELSAPTKPAQEG